MFSKFQLLKKFYHYYFTASNSKGHGMHSPFVFEFITSVLNDKRSYYCYAQVEALRQTLFKNNMVLTLEDFGAGSRVASHHQRAVSFIAKSSLKPRKFGQLLFRIVDQYQPQTIVELGTSLGVTTSYMASANPTAKVITMEGAGQVAALAKQNFESLGLKNIHIVQGNFDHTLPGVLQQLPQVDLAFVDGNHRKEPTIHYFNQLLAKSHDNTILIFDDIHWSAEMEEAWAAIQAHPQVTLTVDLFFIGLVFFRKEQKVKQHFKVRF